MNFDNIKWIEIKSQNEDDECYHYFKTPQNANIEIIENKMVIYIKGNENEKL
jgi:hypothetical protein